MQRYILTCNGVRAAEIISMFDGFYEVHVIMNPGTGIGYGQSELVAVRSALSAIGFRNLPRGFVDLPSLMAHVAQLRGYDNACLHKL